ncbi:MAG: hypothetical protein F6K65_30470 [Moorea sp. SIO3C2]|nr:hypothetical protein [Moorena sp. SIO3C2]
MILFMNGAIAAELKGDRVFYHDKTRAAGGEEAFEEELLLERYPMNKLYGLSTNPELTGIEIDQNWFNQKSLEVFEWFEKYAPGITQEIKDDMGVDRLLKYLALINPAWWSKASDCLEVPRKTRKGL